MENSNHQLNFLPDIPMNVTPHIQLQIHPIRKQATRINCNKPIPNTVRHDPHFSFPVMSSVLPQHKRQTEAVMEPVRMKDTLGEK